MENIAIKITDHAYCRMKQRNGWSRKTSDRMITRVYNKGRRPEQIKGYLKAWVKSKVDEDTNGNDFVMYGQMVYVFRENALVTVLHIPSKEHVVEYIY